MLRGIFLLAFFALPAVVFSEVTFPTGYVTADRVNIRSGPALRAEIIGQVSRGQEVSVIASDGQWCAISPPAGFSGWVTAEYVQEGASVGDRVNIRSGPGVSYARLGKLRKGERVEVLEKEEEWLMITLPSSVYLWINARYLSLDEISPTPVTPTPTPCPAGTPFAPRMAPSYMPSRVLPIRDFSGMLDKMDHPRWELGREFGYKFAAPGKEAYLSSRTIDLERFQNRRVRIWVETLGKSGDGLPLLDVKGVQILW